MWLRASGSLVQPAVHQPRSSGDRLAAGQQARRLGVRRLRCRLRHAVGWHSLVRLLWSPPVSPVAGEMGAAGVGPPGSQRWHLTPSRGPMRSVLGSCGCDAGTGGRWKASTRRSATGCHSGPQGSFAVRHVADATERARALLGPLCGCLTHVQAFPALSHAPLPLNALRGRMALCLEWRIAPDRLSGKDRVSSDPHTPTAKPLRAMASLTGFPYLKHHVRNA